MPADLLADKIISELKNEVGTEGDKFDASTPTKANKAIAKAITDYLKQNTKVMISYVGVNALEVPDPIVADTFQITGQCAPASGTNFDLWLMSLTLNIQTGFQLQTLGTIGVSCLSPALCFMGVTPFTGNQLTLGLKSLHESNDSDPQKPVWTAISNSILLWLNSMVVPTPIACANPTSAVGPTTGTGMITKIIVS